ncbi:MAG: hypothetical protein JXC35_04025, partial [Acholeplasmataceae bacterium]|nr:hypothetical protein [Acholeplasmataceae bacterium]
ENILTSSFGFAIKYPKITKIGQKLAESNFYRTHPMAIKSIEMANQTFENWIQIDVDKGFIKRDIDVKHLARIIVKIINQPIYYENLSDEEITKNKQEIRVLIDLLKKGMETDV